MHLSWLDFLALAVFGAAWFIYSYYVEFSSHGHGSLNSIIHRARLDWMRRCYARENRIFDGQLMAGPPERRRLLRLERPARRRRHAVGARLRRRGAGSVRRAAVLDETTRAAFELKVLGLALIFAYSFFKFVWSYRLFNYVAILMGAMPPVNHPHLVEVEEAIQRAARMNVSAARHFNRGLRAYFFAVAYLGWFAGPLAFMVATIFVAIVLWRRQFASELVQAATWTVDR